MSQSDYISAGDIIDYTPSGAAVKSGDIIVSGDFVGQIVADAADGEKVGLRVEGVIEAPKLSSDVVTLGVKLYWDDTNNRLTLTSTANTLAGRAVESAGNGVTRVKCKLGR